MFAKAVATVAKPVISGWCSVHATKNYVQCVSTKDFSPVSKPVRKQDEWWITCIAFLCIGVSTLET